MKSRSGAVALLAGVVLVVSTFGCTPSPSPTPAATSASPTPMPSPTAPPGPALTKAQFAKLIKSGKMGDRKVNLKRFSTNQNSDPDNEDAENKEQSEAKSCVEVNRLADAQLLDQAAEEEGGVVVQLFAKVEVADELFRLNQTCAAEQAKLDADNALTTLGQGVEGSARWWLIKDPEGLHQITIAYGNVMAYAAMEAADQPEPLVVSLVAQADQLAKG